jgi:hypothetical protein
MKFRKKPVVIEAIQFTGTWPPIVEWLEAIGDGGMAFQPGEPPPIEMHPDANALLIPTLEGTMRADVGDWVIRGLAGEFYPCKPEIFAATYQLGEE